MLLAALHLSLGLGAGLAYDGAGVRGELRYGPAAAAVSIGPGGGCPDLENVTRTEGELDVAVGLRWYFREGAGPFLTLHAVLERCLSRFSRSERSDRSETYVLGAGWRWVWDEHVFLELGAGFVQKHWSIADGAFDIDRVGHGLLAEPFDEPDLWWFPDLMLGVGLEI